MMGERRDKRLEADLIYIEQCERRLSENREAFFGTLGDLFELATLIPVCEQYYGAEHFRDHQAVFELLCDFSELLAFFDQEYKPSAFLTEFMPRKIFLFGSACGRTVQRQRPGAPSAGIRSM